MDLVSLLDIWANKKDTRNALDNMLQIICAVIATWTPEQSELKKPLALPGRPSLERSFRTSQLSYFEKNHKKHW